MNYETSPAGTLARPIAPHDYSTWYAGSGGAGSLAEYCDQYLTDEYGASPFGKLLGEDSLPAQLYGHSISREVVHDIAGRILETPDWTTWLVGVSYSAANTPPAGCAADRAACLAYFNQSLTVSYTEGDEETAKVAELTPDKLLMGISLALPFWPGYFGVTEPAAAADLMLDLVTGGYTAAAVDSSPEKEEAHSREKVFEWSLLALRYALFLG